MGLTQAQVPWRREDVEVAPGLRVALFRAGLAERSARTVVFVHGLGHWTQAAWNPLAAELQDEYRLAGFDLPGFGESSKPNVRYDLAFFTRSLAAVIAHLGVERMTLVGHSLGGLIAASYAANEPQHIELLGLIDPAGFRRTRRLLLYAIGAKPAAWMFRKWPSRRFVRHTLAKATIEPSVVPDWMHERAFAFAQDPEYLRAFSGVYSGAWRDALRLGALHARLARYRGPVLLFWGRHDPYVPIAGLPHARRVYPHAEVTVLERSAHLPNIEEPLAIAQRLRAALAA